MSDYFLKMFPFLFSIHNLLMVFVSILDCQECYRWKRKEHEKFKGKFGNWERIKGQAGKGRSGLQQIYF